MSLRTTLRSIKFKNPFRLHGVDLTLPAGAYLVETDEETMAEISCEHYRRVRTTITVLTKSGPTKEWQVFAIDPQDLEAALSRDFNTTDKSNTEQLEGRTVGVTPGPRGLQ